MKFYVALLFKSHTITKHNKNKVIFKNELYLEFIRLYISDLFPHLSLVRLSCLNYIIIMIVCSSPRFEKTACVDNDLWLLVPRDVKVKNKEKSV